KDSPINGVVELKDKIVAMPLRSRAHVHLFLGRSSSICGIDNPRNFYREVAAPSSAESALDDVCLDKAQAAIVDMVQLATYGDIKPGCFAKLRVLKDSEIFPTGTIVYRKGTIDQKYLNKFRDGLAGAHTTERGRDLLAMFRITSFEAVPQNYMEMCAEILKA